MSPLSLLKKSKQQRNVQREMIQNTYNAKNQDRILSQMKHNQKKMNEVK